VPLPVSLAMLEAAFLEKLPSPIVTRDQIRQLVVDNVAGAGAAGLDALGVRPTSLEVILPTYLERYRKPVRTQRGQISR
jgi:NADH dehydrogenase